MVKVFIDQVECDVDNIEALALSYSSNQMINLESGRVGKRLEFVMRTSPTNNAIFGYAGDVHAAVKFNSVWHPMSVVVDGITLFSGTAYLMDVVWNDAKRYFVVECRGGVLSWADRASSTLLKKIGVEFSGRLNEDSIKASWGDESDVKFFPVVRDRYEPEGSLVDVTGVRRLRSIDDYHPFIRVSALLEAIFQSAEYEFESQTAVAEHFDELYISGGYSSAENSAARAAMGFFVKRAADTSTTTNFLGCVSLSPYDAVSTVGNIVDLETTFTDNECYNRGGVLQNDGEALTFVPLTKISVGFEYYLHYTCDCKIESRSKLKGVDSLDTITNGVIEWEITNRYIDQRDKITTGVYYSATIFDFEQGENYLLMGIDSSGDEKMIAILDERMTEISFDEHFESFELKKYGSSGLFESCDQDWALYFGYVEEIAPVEVKITVRSAPAEYLPTSPMRFELQQMRGGEANVNFTLHRDTSVRPYFSQYPGYNSEITFEDVAQAPYSALELLSSLQHMFNLRFATDQEAKKVRVESFDEFYNGEECDWSDKLLLSEGVAFVDLAHSTHRSTTYGYQQTDGVVKRLGESDNAEFGEWTFNIDSYAASGASQTLLNPILSASTNDEDGVLVVGDRDDITSVDSLNFSPRIVRFLGMTEVNRENYLLPYVSFHAPESDFTLCFEDRDEVAGLNRHYLSYVDYARRSQLLTLSIRLTALEYSNLFALEGESPSLRNKFYFRIYGESFRTILHSIESYDLRSGVARCKFLTID